MSDFAWLEQGVGVNIDGGAKKGKGMSWQRIYGSGEGFAETVQFGDDYVVTNGGIVMYVGTDREEARKAKASRENLGGLSIEYNRVFTPYFKISATRYVLADGAFWVGGQSLSADAITSNDSLTACVAEITQSLKRDLDGIITAKNIEFIVGSFWAIEECDVCIDIGDAENTIVLNGYPLSFSGDTPLALLKELASNALAKMEETNG